MLLPIDDLNGDALIDTFAERHSYSEDTGIATTTVTAAPFHAGANLWSLSTEGETWLFAAGDQDGRPGQELLLESYISDTNSMWSSVASLSGTTGQRRWGLSTREG